MPTLCTAVARVGKVRVIRGGCVMAVETTVLRVRTLGSFPFFFSSSFFIYFFFFLSESHFYVTTGNIP